MTHDLYGMVGLGVGFGCCLSWLHMSVGFFSDLGWGRRV